MKRSRTAVLLLMSTAPLLLTACDHNQSRDGLYTSVDACVAQTNDRSTCSEAFAKAQKDAGTSAPRFANREQCEANYGKEQCAERNDGNNHSFFGPMMTGFFLSQMMRNGTAGSGFNSAPAFRDSNGGWQRPADSGASGGVYRGTTAGTGMMPVNATPNRAVTSSRSGFGRSSASRGFGS